MAADGEGERGRQGDLESGARKKQHLAEVATGAERSTASSKHRPCDVQFDDDPSQKCDNFTRETSEQARTEMNQVQRTEHARVLQPAATFAGEISQIFSVQTAADWHSLRSKDARTYGGTKRGQEQRSPMGAGPLRSSWVAHGIIAQ
jgi:hypothetical protein